MEKAFFFSFSKVLFWNIFKRVKIIKELLIPVTCHHLWYICSKLPDKKQLAKTKTG